MGNKTYDLAKIPGVGKEHRIGKIKFSYGVVTGYGYGRTSQRSILNGEEIRGHVRSSVATEEDVTQLLGWLKENATHHDLTITGTSTTKLKPGNNLDLFVSNAPRTYRVSGDFRRKLTDKEQEIIAAAHEKARQAVIEQRRQAAERKKREDESRKRMAMQREALSDPGIADLAMALRILKKNGLKVVVAADAKERLKK